jgi:hypothetical protein
VVDVLNSTIAIKLKDILAIIKQDWE